MQFPGYPPAYSHYYFESDYAKVTIYSQLEYVSNTSGISGWYMHVPGIGPAIKH